MLTPTPQLPIAVLGAGPVGLAAAAELLQRQLPFVVLEAGAQVGTHLLSYAHVRLFSPWKFNLSPTLGRLLAASGWVAPPDAVLPLAGDVVRLALQPFAELPAIAAALRLNTRVSAISREGFDKVKSAGREHAPFVIRATQLGQPIELRASAVIDATGTWSTPNPLGASGLPALGELEDPAIAARIAYGIPDILGTQLERYAGRSVLVVGAGHSAANALLDLAELARRHPGTRLTWATRTAQLTRVFGGGSADALPARGALGAALQTLRDQGGLRFVPGLRISELRWVGEQLQVLGTSSMAPPDGQREASATLSVDGIDQVICATGQRPDLSLTQELRVKLDPWLESTEALGPLIDPNEHSCGTVRPHGHRELAHPEPGLYTVGVKSYGRAPTFLMATGYEQVRSVVAAIAGDLASANRVELELPATGVCSAPLAAVASATVGKARRTIALASSACCG